MYLQGLSIDPENIDAHQTLREFSLSKASGGKDMGMLEKMKVKTNTADEKANMLAAEKLLAYDPGNTSADARAGAERTRPVFSTR